MRVRSVWFVCAPGVFALSGAAALAGSVPSDINYPSGTQTFENMSVGEMPQPGITGWLEVDTGTGPAFLVNVANEVNSVGGPRPGSSSTKWLRFNDTEGTNVQNRLYSNAVLTPGIEDYSWTFYVNVEATPPVAPSVTSKFTIQHFDTNGGAYANAWGIEFGSTGVRLIVLTFGGSVASTQIYPLSGATAVGQWVKVKLTIQFSDNTISARVNDGSPTSLPINLSAFGDKQDFRFCYRGEGTGNINRVLLDDLSIFVGEESPAVSVAGLVASAMGVLVAGAWVTSRRIRRADEIAV